MAQRQVQTEWLQVTALPNVALIPFDANATVIELSAAATQMARGRVVDDDDGQRQATMLVQPGTTAVLRLPDGTTAPLTTLTVRATEYTEGDRGPEAMPAVLPPAIAYTYCLELSADEAVAVGATSVEFDQPVVFYVENFLGFSVGDIVPAGSYDRVKGTWVPEANGRVVKVLSITNGLADLDMTGDGFADSLDTDERARLGALYAPGTTLWRVEMTHFTPWDLNWPYGPPADACEPGDSSCDLGDGPQASQPDDNACEQAGSIIECQNQILGERIPITGTPYSLNYRSDRVPGRKDGSTLTIPLTGAQLPTSVKQIEVEVEIAGQRLAQSYACPSAPECAPNQSVMLTWDGKDGHGRQVQGLQTATVRVGYTYEAVYRQPADLAASFGAFGTAVTGVRARQELTIWNTWKRPLGGMNLLEQGLGGWSLSAQHTYDLSGKLFLGDGSRRSVAGVEPVIRTLVGSAYSGQWSESGPAISAYPGSPHGIAVAPDGTIYFADGATDRVRAISPDGMIRTVAGTGNPGVGGGYSGDGGPATSALLCSPYDVALGPDGSLYIADGSNNRVRRVNTDGIIHTVAGKTSQQINTGDGGPATEATLAFPDSIAVDATGNLYIKSSNRIRRVDTNGIITTIFNKNGLNYSFGDGGPAENAGANLVQWIALGPNDDLYLTEGSRVRRIDRDGIITTIAGSTQAGSPYPDGIPAKNAKFEQVDMIAVAPDGTIFVAEGIPDSAHYQRVRRIGTDGILTTVAGARDPTCLDYYCGEGGPARVAQFNVISGIAVDPNGAVLNEAAPRRGWCSLPASRA
jgi:hypothetical protein